MTDKDQKKATTSPARGFALCESSGDLEPDPVGRRRCGLLAAMLVAMSLPSIDAAIIASAVVTVAAMIMAWKWTSDHQLPRSLLILRAGMALTTIGIVVRIVEAGQNDGEFVFPGAADLFAVPAYVFGAVGMGMAVLSRHALAKTADVVDAAAVSVSIITVAIVASSPFLFSATIDPQVRALSILYTVVEFAFFATVVALIYGPTTSIRSTRWLAAAGLYATGFDTMLNVMYSYGWDSAVDQSLRTLAFPVVAYAISTSFPDYVHFAQPGVRTQRFRWASYALCFGLLATVMTLTDSLVAAVGLFVFGALTSGRLGIAHTISTRLTALNRTQRSLAEALSNADGPQEALDAGRDACVGLLGTDQHVDVSAIELDLVSPKDHIALYSEAAHVSQIVSTDRSIKIAISDTVPSHQWSALSQIANVLSFAVRAVSARTERVKAEAEANWMALSGTDNEMVFVLDNAGVVVRSTPNAKVVLLTDPVGGKLSRLLGHDLSDLLGDEVPEILFTDDESTWFSVTAQPAESDGTVVTVRDATARFRANYIDPVTGLYNTAHFATQPDASGSTLIMFMVNNFARINNSLGKRGADDLLKTVADRIQNTFRDGIDDVWRGDGPTFIVMCSGAEQTDSWVQDRADIIAETVSGAGRQTHIEVTTVIVPLPEQTPVATALHRADITLSNHKTPSRIVLRFTEALEENTHRRYRIEESLAAVDDPASAGFRPHYQPIINAHDGTVARVEALLRWQHPTLGYVSPVEFIAAAERTGRVHMLDKFVMETACIDLIEFQKISPGLGMQVNLSPVGLTIERILEIANWVRTNCATPSDLTIEIIESAVGDDFMTLVPALSELCSTGVGLSCDDYGDGESNMARLARVPWTQVKLAGVFMTDVDPQTVARMIGTIQTMGDGRKVVVENVEEEAQADAVQAAGADFIQGWLISRDLPAQELAEFLTNEAARLGRFSDHVS